jgi:hypothetical protein
VAVILNKYKHHLYLKINGILSSLKLYITCEIVTRGYFFIDVLTMQILRIHPVLAWTRETSFLRTFPSFRERSGIFLEHSRVLANVL